MARYLLHEHGTRDNMAAVTATGSFIKKLPASTILIPKPLGKRTIRN